MYASSNSSRPTRSTVHDGSTIGPSLSTSSVSCRPLCRSRTTVRTPRIDPSGRRGPIRIRCDSSSSSTLPASRTPPLGQQDDVIADALDVRDHVRRDHDRRRRLGHAVHQKLQELAAGERVEAGERLVEQHELRPLAEREREREPRPVARRERADLRPRRDLREQLGDDLLVPARVRPACVLDRVGNGEASGRAARPARRTRPRPAPTDPGADRTRARRSILRSARAGPSRARAASTCPPRSGRPGRRSHRCGIVSVQSRSPHSRRKRFPSPRASSGVGFMPRGGPASPGALRRSAPGCSRRRGRRGRRTRARARAPRAARRGAEGRPARACSR